MFKTMSDVRRHNREKGYHFFDRSTNLFFRSRVESALYGGHYFVTSEQYAGIDGTERPRKFTVRRANDDGSIKTIGDFQQYRSVEDARLVARFAARSDVAVSVPA